MLKTATGPALRAARERQGMRQADLGEVLHLSDRMISMVEQDQRRLAKDVKARAIEFLNDGQLTMAVARDATGGVLTPPWLDGPAADLHPASVAGRTDEELVEMQEERIKVRRILLRAAAGEPSDDLDRQRLRHWLDQQMDAIHALEIEPIVGAALASIPLADISRAHDQKIQVRHYVKGRR